MTISCVCTNCGSKFYIYGKAEEAFGKLVDAKIVLDTLGYDEPPILVGKIVQSRAKCCKKPSIYLKSWR